MSGFKQIKLIIDDIDMLMMRQYYIKKLGDAYVCDGIINKVRNEEELLITLESSEAYNIFKMTKGTWGNWNDCPNWREMWAKAKEWYERYEAEVVKLSHDTVWFKCARCLNDREADVLIKDFSEFAPNSIAHADTIKKCLSEKGEFVLWWDEY